MMRLWISVAFFASGMVHAAYAPSFPATLVDGTRTTFEELLPKNKVLLLSFWATWCVPCLQELNTLSTQLKTLDIPVKVVTINVDTSESKSQVRPTIAQLKKDSGFGFDVVLDPTHAIFSKYQSNSALPYSVLIGADGVILDTFVGYQQSMLSRVQMLATQAFPASGVKKSSSN